MDDLNLIPYELKAAEESKRKRTRNIILAGLGLILITALSCLPLYLTYKLDIANSKTEAQINSLSYVTDEINKLTLQKSVIQSNMQVLNALTAGENRWSTVISEVSKLVPEDVSIYSFTAGPDGIALQCTSSGMQSIAVFYGKLENNDRFTELKINDISPVAEKSLLSFNIFFRLKSVQGGVK